MRRGRPLEIDWQESAEELFEAYGREKDIHRRTRLQALWQLRQGKTLREIETTVGVSYRTLQRWVAWYRGDGLTEVLERTPGHAASGRAGYLTAEQEAEVKAEADKGAFRTAQEVAEWIAERWGVHYRQSGIYKLIYRLGLRPKVPRRQAEQASAAAQEAWKKGV
jgi:transposase